MRADGPPSKNLNLMFLYGIPELFNKNHTKFQILLRSFENSIKIKSLQILDSVHPFKTFPNVLLTFNLSKKKKKKTFPNV